MSHSGDYRVALAAYEDELFARRHTIARLSARNLTRFVGRMR